MEELRAHFLQTFCNYRRFRSCFKNIHNYKYFDEIESDEMFEEAVQILPGRMSEAEVNNLLQELINTRFAPDGV